MRATTARQKDMVKALRALAPLIVFADSEEVVRRARSKTMRDLAPADAVFLALIAHIRHRHTDYDALLEEGYDHESARHFVLDDINAVLEDWGSQRRLEMEEDETEAETDQ